MRRQLSASLIKHSELFLVDIEGGNRLAQFCAITATTTANTAADVNQRSRCLNIYNVDALSDKKLSQINKSLGQPTKVMMMMMMMTTKKGKRRRRRPTMTGSNQLGGGGAAAYRYANFVGREQMLPSIGEFLASASSRPSVLIAHSAHAADSANFTHNLLSNYVDCRRHLASPEHNRVVGYIDTLPLFRRFFPGLTSYRQQDLVRYFFGGRYNAHNALDDSLMLYALWNKYLRPSIPGNLHETLAEVSISNIYCVDRFLAKGGGENIPVIHDNTAKTCNIAKRKRRSRKPRIEVFPTAEVMHSLYPSVHNNL